jgi:phosphoglycerate dehydrogenase-like enzyme
MSNKPKLLISLKPTLYQELFSAEADTALRQTADIIVNQDERNWSVAELAEQLPGCDVIITGWGTPSFAAEVLEAATDLRLIAHSAGSIKRMLPPAVFERGINVTHAAAAIAPAVAEMTLTLILLCLRKVNELDRALKAGQSWAEVKEIGLGSELSSQRVGVVGAGHTGQNVIRLLKPLAAEVCVYDPYLRPTEAEALGVSLMSLDTLLKSCPIVTMQAPPTSETHHMIGAKELGLLQDGAIFINTARSHLVNQAALLDELQSGRIQAAIDVFDDEPLPLNSPFRQLDNVIITPHIAGATRQTRRRQGSLIVEEIKRFFNDEPLQYRVTQQMLATMA